MKQKITKLLLVITGGVLFNLLFWQEKMGLNLAIYDVFLLVGLYRLYPLPFRHPVRIPLLAAHLWCLAMVLLHNTLLAKLGFVITLGLVAAFSEYAHRSVWYAGGSLVLNSTLVFPEMITLIQFREKGRQQWRWKLGRRLRLALVPLALLFLFIIIYSNANGEFGRLVNELTVYLNHWMEGLLNWFSIPRLLFLLLGIYLTGMVLVKSSLAYFEKSESAHNDALSRRRLTLRERIYHSGYAISRILFGRYAGSVLSLKYFNRVGLGSLVLLNLLLLVVNSIDIWYLWFNPEYARQTHLYQLVHQGTDLLLLSLLLAISVVLIFFQGNLNFFSRNGTLKAAAYCWLLQNLVLAVSVFFRDYYYIRFAGLAYKRIGVLAFLLMVVAGLVTVFIKISRRKSLYFLFRVNGWVAIGLLVLACSINWDPFIARYNLAHQKETPLDVEFMAGLGNKAIPILDAHRSDLQAQQELLEKRGFSDGACSLCYQKIMDANRENFLRDHAAYSWLSWNLADEEIADYFNRKAKK